MVSAAWSSRSIGDGVASYNVALSGHRLAIRPLTGETDYSQKGGMES
jgi:hypothetical protein